MNKQYFAPITNEFKFATKGIMGTNDGSLGSPSTPVNPEGDGEHAPGRKLYI